MKYIAFRCTCGKNVGAHVPDALIGEKLGASGPAVGAAAWLDLAALKTMPAGDRICDKAGAIVCRFCGRAYDAPGTIIRGLGR